VVLLHPDAAWAAATAVVVAPATLFGIWRHDRIAARRDALQLSPAQ
jgi:hypothetical protein